MRRTTARGGNGPGKKITSDKDNVVVAKRKPYQVSTSKKTQKEEDANGTRGRNQSNRSEAFKKDVKKAGGVKSYLDGMKAAKARVKKNPTRT